MDSEDIDTLLDSWNQTKNEIASLERKLEKYKRAAERIMCKERNNSIEGSYYKLKKRVMSRNTLSKKDVPVHIWDQYSRECSYTAYYLSKK